MLQVQLLSENATLPSRGSAFAAGYDLYASEKCVIPPSLGRQLVRTGIAIAIPPGHYGRVAPRSGLTLKQGIHIGAGVIDEDYRGEIGVIIFNLGQHPFRVEPGDKIAQLILERISTPDICVVAELEPTVRGEGGFGSTGN